MQRKVTKGEIWVDNKHKLKKTKLLVILDVNSLFF